MLMDKKTIVIMGLLVLLSGAMFASTSILHVNAQNFPVHNLNTGLSYASIQNAINAPQTLNGHTILVDPGTYPEQVVVNKTLTVVGANAETTIVDGLNLSTSTFLFRIGANETVIENFTLRNTNQNPFSFSPAIDIFKVENVTVKNSIITNAVIGIRIQNSSFVTVADCRIHAISTGINFQQVSHNDTIIGNTFETNPTALNFADLEGKFSRVFHNNFVNNINDVFLVAPNYLDDGYPNGGNYWSKYTGLDLAHGPSQNESGSDGIGDTSYNVIGSLDDNYPLMGNFSDFSISSGVKTYEVDMTSNSTISGFEFSATSRTIQFSVFGTSGMGFCGISIPYGLIFPPYNVTVDGAQSPYSDLYDNGTFRWVYFAYNHTQHTVMIQSAASIRVQSPTELSPAYMHPGATLTVTIVYTEASALNLTIEVFNATSIISNLTVTGGLQNGTAVLRSDVLLFEGWVAEGFYGVNVTLFNTADLSRQATEANSVVVDVTAPTIGDVSQNPPGSSVHADNAVMVNVEVTDALSGLKQVTLSYIIDDGSWTNVAMTNLAGGIYSATIPSFAYNTSVTYVITAEDNANNAVTTQDLGYMFHYRVIPEFPTLLILLVIMVGTLSAVAVHRKTLFRRRSTCA